MKKICLLALLVILSAAYGAPAMAQSYYERIWVPLETVPSIAPHATPNTYTFNNEMGISGDTSTSSVTFASTPAPFVLATSSSSGEATAVRGSLVYLFSVVGPALSNVPIDFTANYSVANGGFGTLSFAGIALAAPFGGGAVSLLATCTTICTVNTTATPNSVGDSVFTTYSGGGSGIGGDCSICVWSVVDGLFTGIVLIPTNAFGQGVGVVELDADANVNGYGNAYGLTGVSSAFADPILRIDPTYLAAYPNTTLTLPDGVGNASTTVPEPQAYTLMLIGLAALWFAVRGRKA